MKHCRILLDKNKHKIGGKLKTLAFLVFWASLLGLSNSSLAAQGQEKMVFLVEDANGKHVGQSQDFANYELLTQGNLWHLYPAISSDGNSLAYVQGEDSNSLQMVVKSPGRLDALGEKGFLLHPRFAKNDQLLFFSQKIDGENRIVKFDLQKARTELNPEPSIVSDSEGYFPAPFANGEKVVYQRNTSGSLKEIVLYNLIDQSLKVLDEGMAPALSKDERFVAYTKKVQGNWDIYIYNLFTEKIIRVTRHERFDFSPAFDREGNLFYTSDRLEEGVFSIFSQSYQSWSQELGDERVRISKKGTSFYAPRLSGDTTFKLSSNRPMIGEPRSSFGAIEHKGRVYVAGGHQGAEHTYPPESFTGRVEFYDLSLGQWFNTAPRNYKCHGFQLAAHGNYIYAFGGFAFSENTKPQWKSLDVVERYDIRTQEWEVIGQMPRRRSSNVVMKVGSKVYLIGGWDATPKFENDYDGTFHSAIDVFDLETESFTTLEEKLPLKRRAFSAFTKEGIIYLAGGISEGASHFNLLDHFTAFDPVLRTFSEMPKLPFATFAPASGVIGNSSFVFGGMLKLGEWEYEYMSHIYEFDFATGKWSHTGRYMQEDKGFSQVVNIENTLGILGGHSYQNDTDSPVATFELFSRP